MSWSTTAARIGGLLSLSDQVSACNGTSVRAPAASNACTAKSCLPCTAAHRGVDPKSVTVLTRAPRAISKLMASSCPVLADSHNAVRPSSEQALTLAPAFSSTSTSCTNDLGMCVTATKSGVYSA